MNSIIAWYNSGTRLVDVLGEIRNFGDQYGPGAKVKISFRNGSCTVPATSDLLDFLASKGGNVTEVIHMFNPYGSFDESMYGAVFTQ